MSVLSSNKVADEMKLAITAHNLVLQLQDLAAHASIKFPLSTWAFLDS